MSNKITCPSCRTHTSSVFQARMDGEPCPYCGLSAQAGSEIDEIATSRADTALVERCRTLTIELDKARTALRDADARLRAIRLCLDSTDLESVLL